MVEFEKAALKASLLSNLGLSPTSIPSPATMALRESLHCAHILFFYSFNFYLFISNYFFVFFFFLRKISPELTSAANPPLFAEEDCP